MVEAVQTYVNLVSGLSRATLGTARTAARGLLGQVGLQGVADDAERRVAKLTEEILAASRANRQLLENVVAAEVARAASRWGFVRFEDLDEVREEIAEVRAELRRQQQANPVDVSPAAANPTTEAGA